MGHLALGTAPQRAWTAKIEGSSKSARLASAPVVSGGRLFAIGTDARVRAFDASTGAPLWSTELGSKGNSGSLFGGGVSAEGERVFATSGVGDVAAFNAADGTILWKKRPGGPLRGAPTISSGNVYVMSQDNQIFALNAENGDLVWSESGTLEVTGVFGVAAPAAGQGTVIAGYSSGELSAYRYENGRSLWGDALSRTSISTSVASLSDIDADPVIDRGRVYAVGQGGRMASYELVTGQRLWEINVAGISTPWVAGEWLFVVTDDAKLLCVARATGRIRWISQLKHYRKAKKKQDPLSWSGPVLAGGRLILVSTEGDLVYVNPVDGSILSSQEMDASLSLSPVVANNMLYILDDDGKLTAYR
jgi:outer membrane protein assembly factor BamB